MIVSLDDADFSFLVVVEDDTVWLVDFVIVLIFSGHQLCVANEFALKLPVEIWFFTIVLAAMIVFFKEGLILLLPYFLFLFLSLFLCFVIVIVIV